MFNIFWIVCTSSLVSLWHAQRTRRSSTRKTDAQWRHKSNKSENLGQCGRQNMLGPYLKFGSGSWFSATQCMQFPHWASLVRGAAAQLNQYLSNNSSNLLTEGRQQITKYLSDIQAWGNMWGKWKFVLAYFWQIISMDAQRGNSLCCTAKNSLLLPNS